MNETAYVAGVVLACAGFVGFLAWDFSRAVKSGIREDDARRTYRAKQMYLEEHGPQLMFTFSEGDIKYKMPWK